MKNTKGNTGNRYTDGKKKEILAFIENNGRGGISAAQAKYGVSYIAIRSWKDKGLGKTKSMKKVLAKIPAKRGRPALVKTNRPSFNGALAKALSGLRASVNKVETKFMQLEAMIAT